MSGQEPFRVLVLCAHNRTRSVMAAALLRQYLGDDDRFVVESAGFGPSGEPPIGEAVLLLTNRGIDVSEHRSRRLTPEMVRRADLVLTAEKQQVMSVVADFGGDFNKTFTLPEYAESFGGSSNRPRGLAYIKATIPELTDPTGRSDLTWQRVWHEIDGCSVAAAALVAVQV